MIDVGETMLPASNKSDNAPCALYVVLYALKHKRSCATSIRRVPPYHGDRDPTAREWGDKKTSIPNMLSISGCLSSGVLRVKPDG